MELKRQGGGQPSLSAEDVVIKEDEDVLVHVALDTETAKVVVVMDADDVEVVVRRETDAMDATYTLNVLEETVDVVDAETPKSFILVLFSRCGAAPVCSISICFFKALIE